jgi:hypothetical protein
MAAKVALYESLLTDLLPTQVSDVQQAIRSALAENRHLVDEDVAASREGTVSGDEANEDEYSVSAGAGSPWFQDRAQQYTAGCARFAGYLGEASAVRWMEEASIRATTSGQRQIG